MYHNRVEFLGAKGASLPRTFPLGTSPPSHISLCTSPFALFSLHFSLLTGFILLFKLSVILELAVVDQGPETRLRPSPS
jgi:hypothetical protein